ncbi:hypothetical protein I7I48_01045 [Histoplasma ohiense]|nr:hypothetical protein I7I48_01045 [Histoplasma ohiense (nom. inval.)]
MVSFVREIKKKKRKKKRKIRKKRKRKESSIAYNLVVDSSLDTNRSGLTMMSSTPHNPSLSANSDVQQE